MSSLRRFFSFIIFLETKILIFYVTLILRKSSCAIVRNSLNLNLDANIYAYIDMVMSVWDDYWVNIIISSSLLFFTVHVLFEGDRVGDRVGDNLKNVPPGCEHGMEFETWFEKVWKTLKKWDKCFHVHFRCIFSINIGKMYELLAVAEVWIARITKTTLLLIRQLH